VVGVSLSRGCTPINESMADSGTGREKDLQKTRDIAIPHSSKTLFTGNGGSVRTPRGGGWKP